jgi:alpha-methylacyl-CoA racemase
VTGPLQGFRVVEMGGIGPAPFAGGLLGDLGADVLRIDRVAQPGAEPETPPRFDFYNRNKRSVALDLKKPGAAATVLKLVEKADALIEGFRPGVMERLGLGPDVCRKANPKLVYARMTGWGQSGPIAVKPATTSTISRSPALYTASATQTVLRRPRSISSPISGEARSI